MTEDNSKRSIDIIREMTSCAKQLILLDALERLLQVAKDGDDLKFLPLLSAMADYASAQTAKDASEQPKELNPILLSLIALLNQKGRELP